jgi:8-oxo-dGTP pyrophosphatase MutT (NUDIX family)
VVQWTFQQRLFRLIFRTCAFLYRRFPVFGPLRAAIAIIQRGELFLVIERSDGLGLGFPGGLARPWEPDQRTLAREVREETGMCVTSSSLLVRYTNSVLYPCQITAYRVEVQGEVQSSWEGIPCWVGLDELYRRLLTNQRPVLERLLERR